jgi:hypothetical protein
MSATGAAKEISTKNEIDSSVVSIKIIKNEDLTPILTNFDRDHFCEWNCCANLTGDL